MKRTKKSVSKKSENNFLLFLKGSLMGLFDLVPGISGGSMALISGIYEKLVFELNNFFVFINSFFCFSKKKILSSWKKLDVLFLIILILGIISGIIVSVFVLSFLLDNFFVQTMGVIAGIILVAGFFMVKKHVRSSKLVVIGLFGLLLGVLLSFLSPSLSTEFNLLGIFLLGLIVIIAMILPGISGALILLLLGGYEFMIGSLRTFLSNPFVFSQSHLVVGFFLLGAVFGLGIFSKVVSYFLRKHKQETMSFLSFLMIGAVTKPVLEILGANNSFFAIPFLLIVVFFAFIFCFFKPYL